MDRALDYDRYGRGRGRGGGGGGRFNDGGFRERRDNDGRSDFGRGGRGDFMGRGRGRGQQMNLPVIERVGHPIPPIVSLQTFKNLQNDAAPLHVVHSRYEDLINHYIGDFCDLFFHTNKGEEWFQERYHPCKIAQQEKDAAEWAISSSKEMLESLLNAPKKIVSECNLDPPSDWNKKQKVEGIDGGNKDVTATESSEIQVIDASKEVDENDDKDNGAPNNEGLIKYYGKHMPGHEDRAVYISNIHAGCPKSVLKSKIFEKLQEAGVPLPERVLIGQPAWTSKLPLRFLKAGFLVMKTVADARKAFKVLRDFEVRVPEVPHPEQLDDKVGVQFKFILHASIHDCDRQKNKVHSFYSHFERIKMDTIKGKELADLLDEFKGIPEATRLNAILDENMHPEIAEAFVLPTDKLDITIAYLRRVHFVSFYAARRYMDEAHLMLLSPSIHFRESKPRDPPAANENEDADRNDKKRKREEDEPAEEEIEDGEEKEEGNKEDVEKRKFIHPRIERMIADLKKAVERKRELLSNPSLEKTKEEKDPKELEAKIEKVRSDMTAKSCTVEKDGRARCLYKVCNKLFKSMDFLVKHLKSKHEYFGYMNLVAEAEPYMRARYDAEDINMRPLPLVEVDNMGIIEKRSIRDITSMLGIAKQIPHPHSHPPLPPTLPLPPPHVERRWSGGGGRGGDMPNQSRRGSFPPRDISKQQHHSPRTEGGIKMAQFMDVDAPKVSLLSSSSLLIICIYPSIHDTVRDHVARTMDLVTIVVDHTTTNTTVLVGTSSSLVTVLQSVSLSSSS